MVLVIFNKSCVLLNEAQLDFQEGPGRAPKRVFGALARSQGALGTRVQVHGACLGGRLDRQEFARAQLLREIPSVFNNSIFCFERFLEGPEAVLEACSGAKGASKGCQKGSIDFLGVPRGSQIGTSIEKMFFWKMR